MRVVKQSSRGYTLIELMLVMGLLGIVLTTIGLMVRQGYQLHYVQLDRLEAHQNGRIALDFIKKACARPLGVARIASTIAGPLSWEDALMTRLMTAKFATTWMRAATEFASTAG